MAVNIWEGEKAQALIDAVANGSTGSGAKVDKYQGVGYAGKTLVVGSDGMVTFGNAGISDNAKLALIHCLQHMSFLDDKGPELIERLQTELFSGGNDSRIAYEIPSGTDISAMAFDTHQRSFQVYEDFTFIAKCTINMSATSLDSVSLVDSMVVVPGTSLLKGIRIIAQKRNGKLSFTTFFNGWPAGGGGAGGTTPGFSLDDEHSVIFIIKNQSKKVTVKTYVDGTLSLNNTETLDDKAGDIITYHVGENAAKTYMPWPGTIEMFRFYNVCLNNSEIEYLLNISL